MASVTTRSTPGFTRITKPRGAAKPSGIVLADKDGNDWALWFDTTGDLRTAQVSTIESASFAPESDGTVIGSQS